MGKTDMTYWKWNKKFNPEKFYLGEELNLDSVKEELKIRYSENYFEEYELKNKDSVVLRVFNQEVIAIQYFNKLPIIGQMDLQFKFFKEAETLVREYFEPCEADYEGEKLILCYLDLILRSIIIKK